MVRGHIGTLNLKPEAPFWSPPRSGAAHTSCAPEKGTDCGPGTELVSAHALSQPASPQALQGGHHHSHFADSVQPGVPPTSQHEGLSPPPRLRTKRPSVPERSCSSPFPDSCVLSACMPPGMGTSLLPELNAHVLMTGGAEGNEAEPRVQEGLALQTVNLLSK